MSSSPSTPDPRVLSTLNKDGTRRWLFPRVSPGRFLRWRRVVAYGLILLFAILPWIRINGRQSILIDLPAREFTFFGATFLPTDTLLLVLLLAGIFVSIFLVTALFGRLWCGWACPQTVYMEFVYRPIERLFDGSPDARRRGGRGARGFMKVLKYAVYLAVSLVLAHIFLSYFVGVERLFQWMRQSPFEHPTAFVVMAVTTGLMMFDFTIFREQTCIVACPYGRFQSVLLDRHSLIISYDEHRGEPRGRMRRAGRETSGDVALPQLGDCIDCKLCVTTCPTGIDIRSGLQMECIGCAQCIDACDAVMTKIGRAVGLIRYSSQEAIEGKPRHVLRPRVVLYPALLAVVVGLFVGALVGRQPADITLLRGGRQAYVTLPSGEVANELRIKIVNRTDAVRQYDFGVEGVTGARLTGPDLPVSVEPGAALTTGVSIIVPRDSFELGRARISVSISDDDGFSRRMTYRLQGPWGSTAGPTGGSQGDET
jgi:cytochrome c oxidase accessory protein FixG